MPSASVIGLPWRKRLCGTMSSFSCPSADQSRMASSSNLSLFEIQTARRRPFSQLSSRMPATCRPLPAPVPSPRNQPRRKRMAASLPAVVIAGGGDHIQALIDLPASGEMARVRLARVDDAFELGIRKQAVGDDARGKMRPVGRFGRLDGSHRRRLDEFRRMRPGAVDADGLDAVGFVDRVAGKSLPRTRSGDARCVGSIVGAVAELERRLRRCRRKRRGLARAERADRQRKQRGLRGWRGSRAASARSHTGRGGTCAATRSSNSCGALRHGRAWKVRESVRCGHAVDDGEAGFDGGAVAAVERTRNPRREDDPHLKVLQGVAQIGVARRGVDAGDRDEAAARGEALERGAQMAEIRAGDAALHVGRGREGRVHEDDAWAHGLGQIVVNLLGVEARDGDGREQQREQIGACLGDLVERERCAVKLGEDGELPGSGRGFEHQIGGRDRGRERGDEAKLDGRRELLELLAFFRAARVGRRERGEPAQHVEQPRVRARASAHRGEVAAQEEQLRCLARLVGVLPDPGAFAVGGAERFASSLRAACARRALRRVRGSQGACRPPEADAPRGGHRRRRAVVRGGQGRIGRRRRQVAWAGTVRLEGGKRPGRPALAKPARTLSSRPPLPLRRARRAPARPVPPALTRGSHVKFINRYQLISVKARSYQ